jgi:hypothetical protein
MTISKNKTKKIYLPLISISFVTQERIKTSGKRTWEEYNME